MPSLMIHLLIAYKCNPNASTAFWIGNIAPDSVSGRKEKDKSHFRDRVDRRYALRELAHNIDLNDDYAKGVLLHLFLDYYWDSYPMRDFIDNFKDVNWFTNYRHEIALAGDWLFHHTEWSRKVWNEMIEYPLSEYSEVHGIIKEDVADLIIRNYKWHIENNIGPSSAFTPEFIDEFSDKVAIDFKSWLNTEI
jgi:hypothetical protein